MWRSGVNSGWGPCVLGGRGVLPLQYSVGTELAGEMVAASGVVAYYSW
jgi:hypothetical protein